VKTLIADDDLACRFLLQAFLSRFGVCQIALNGYEAVDAFEAAEKAGAPFDLICMDIQMPQMDGKEAALRVRKIEEDAGVGFGEGVKIVMTTAMDELRDDVELFHAHCDSYLGKPIDLRLLLTTLKQLKLVEP
jgi:two-component system chemotaxis response regulator CheY